MLIAAFVLVGVLLLLASILSVSDNLINIEAQKEGIDTKKYKMGVVPSIKELFGSSVPEDIGDGSYHNLKKGFDIKLTGAVGENIQTPSVNRFAIKPTDFRGIAPIPKIEVELGDDVKAGDPIFHDKSNPNIKYAAPVSGEIVEIRRGAKRSISHVVVLADKSQESRHYDNIPSIDSNREDIVSFLTGSGIWPYINQRPFDLIADPDIVPDNIFISTFNSAPLSLDLNLVVQGKERHFQSGIDVLSKLTNGSVHLGIDGRMGKNPHYAFTDASNAEKHYFNGKHPCGNVGVQIHHVAPIKSNQNVWTLKVETVISLGKLMLEGKYDLSRMVAMTGTKFDSNHIVNTYEGASLEELVKDNVKLKNGNTRVIFGDVLSGKRTGKDDFLPVNCNQLSAIEEGDYYELFGWLMPIAPRPSLSKTFPGFLMPNYEFKADTNTHGELRAFVVTGQYEKVLPMNIFPQHLMKAIMAGDIERMEGLGINELTEEDIALCEFACTSKMPLQRILREGLEMMREQA